MDGASVKELRELLDSYRRVSEEGPVRGGIISEGDAAAYALVWEWGNARQTKKGPKTVRGINPDGEEVWLSIQAPFGYIRINEPEYINIIQQKLGEIDLSDVKDAEGIREEIKSASASAAEMITEIIRHVAPVDTGALRESIQPADPGDPDLAVEDDEIELGEATFGHVIREMLKNLKG